MRRTVNKKKHKKSTLGTILKITLLLAVSALICITAYGIYLSKQAESAANNAFESLDDREHSDLRSQKVTPLEDNISVLFVGIDDSEQRGQGAEKSRSDALLLATLNNDTKTIKLLSIPRDSYVHIPYVDYKDKITHAHAFGGTLATVETVEQLFNVPIDYYVRMNFNAFIEIIDALGGIEAEVPYKLLEKDEHDANAVNLEPGFQHLNGSEALALARTRKQDSDIMRGQRQQEILGAIANKVASPSTILKVDDLFTAVGNNMKTNMTFDEMKSLISFVANGLPRIDNLTLEGYDDMSTGVYYYQLQQPSVEETSFTLRNHLGLTLDELEQSTADSYTNDLNTNSDDNNSYSRIPNSYSNN